MSNRWEHELQQCLDTDIDFPVAEFIKLHSKVPPPTIRRRHAQLRATLMKRLQKRAALGIQASTVASLNTPESQAAKGSCGGKRNTAESQADKGKNNTAESQAAKGSCGGKKNTSESQADKGKKNTAESQAIKGKKNTAESQAAKGSAGGKKNTSESQADKGKKNTAESQAIKGKKNTAESQAAKGSAGGKKNTAESQAAKGSCGGKKNTSESQADKGKKNTAESQAIKGKKNTAESQAAKGSFGGITNTPESQRNKGIVGGHGNTPEKQHIKASGRRHCGVVRTVSRELFRVNASSPSNISLILFRLMGQYKKLQSFYLNICANQKLGTQNELAKPFYIQELATTLCSIQLDFQDIGLVDHSVIDLVNTLVNKWNPQVLQQSNTSALLSLNLLYNCNIDMAGVCALQVLVNHFAVDVHTTISCDAFDSPHLYSDDD